MELRHLRYFVAVAEELSFRRAAERLHIAQPPLSVQIRQIETEVGAELFSREKRKIRLTEAGRVFLEHARQTLAYVNRSVVLTRQAANGEVGHLSIGCGTAAEFRVFPTLVPLFKKQWPNVHLTFHNLRTPRQIEQLRRDELDLAFAWLPVPSQEFESHALAKEPFVVMLAANHPLASATSLSIKDLSKEPLILFSRNLDLELFHQIEQLFLEAGAVMNVAYELESLVSMLNFVTMGVGCSVFPDYIRMLPRQGLVYRPLRAPNLVKTLGVIRKRDKRGLAESFYRFTMETMRETTGKRPRGRAKG